MEKHEKNLNHAKDEAQRTLQAIDSLESIEPSPYFYARLQQKIHQSEDKNLDWIFRLTLGYKLLPLGLVILVMFNVITLIVGFSELDSSIETQSTQVQELAKEYSMNNWDFSSYQAGE